MRETIKKPDPVRPEDIEKRSMEIICQELGERHVMSKKQLRSSEKHRRCDFANGAAELML